MDELVVQVVSAHRARAESSGIRLHAHTDPGLWLDADPVRMSQALGNLISNALRHTPADGTVTVTAWPADDLPHVFERFWRAEKSRSRHTGGSGLGLSIVRQLVEGHGGTVTADNRPGNGAVYTIWLPHARQPDGPTEWNVRDARDARPRADQAHHPPQRWRQPLGAAWPEPH